MLLFLSAAAANAATASCNGYWPDNSGRTSTRRVDVRPLLSGQYPLEDAVAAFHAAADKNRSTKVQVVAA